MDAILVALTYKDVTRLLQAVSVSRDPIAELTREMHEDPERAMKELDALQKKLGKANKIMNLRAELSSLEQDLQKM
jgi:uncharacterized protein YbjQ (UPF0145 family)